MSDEDLVPDEHGRPRMRRTVPLHWPGQHPGLIADQPRKRRGMPALDSLWPSKAGGAATPIVRRGQEAKPDGATAQWPKPVQPSVATSAPHAGSAEKRRDGKRSRNLIPLLIFGIAFGNIAYRFLNDRAWDDDAVISEQEFTRLHPAEDAHRDVARVLPVADRYTREISARWAGGQRDLSIHTPESLGVGLEGDPLLSNVSIDDGVVVLAFGRGVHPELEGRALGLRPYVDRSGNLQWVCGYAMPPDGAAPLVAEPERFTTIEPQFLPSNCRDYTPKKAEPSKAT